MSSPMKKSLAALLVGGLAVAAPSVLAGCAAATPKTSVTAATPITAASETPAGTSSSTQQAHGASDATAAGKPARTVEPVALVDGVIVENDDIMKIVIPLAFDDVEMSLRAELAQRNLNIVNVLDVQKALAGRGTTFPRYVVFQFCNLQDGLALFHDHEDYGAFIPCSVLVYEKNGKTVLVARRPSAIVDRLIRHTPTAQSVEIARKMEGYVRAVFTAIADEARAAH